MRMPNSPAPDKLLYALRMPRTLFCRLEKLAATRHESVKDTVIAILTLAVSEVSLTPEDYMKIAKATQEAVIKYGKQRRK